MVYAIIDHKYDAINCSKFTEWNYEPQAQASGFTTKFRTFYGFISMVYKSVEHGKLWSICFLQEHLFLRKTKNKTTGTAHMLRHFHGL